MLERLNALREEKYLTKRIFARISENMHYELFKYLNSMDLLEIRILKLGGYQLISNPILRSRITNYLHKLQVNIIPNNIQENVKRIKLIFQLMGKNKLIFREKSLNLEMGEKDWVLNCFQIFQYIPELSAVKLSNLHYFIDKHREKQFRVYWGRCFV